LEVLKNQCFDKNGFDLHQIEDMLPVFAATLGNNPKLIRLFHDYL